MFVRTAWLGAAVPDDGNTALCIVQGASAAGERLEYDGMIDRGVSFDHDAAATASKQPMRGRSLREQNEVCEDVSGGERKSFGDHERCRISFVQSMM